MSEKKEIEILYVSPYSWYLYEEYVNNIRSFLVMDMKRMMLFYIKIPNES